MNLSEWRARLERERKQKDWFFAVNPRSPIPPGKREDFTGLDYYPPNPEYRFELKLHEYNEKNRLRMTATSGEAQEYIRWASFGLGSAAMNTGIRRTSVIQGNSGCSFPSGTQQAAGRPMVRGIISTLTLRGIALVEEGGL